MIGIMTTNSHGLLEGLCPINEFVIIFRQPRIKIETGASTLAVACPYCMSMFEDSVLSLDKGDVIEIKDIAELLQEVI